MVFLGLVPGKRSAGDPVRRASLTLAGNRRARRALLEAAWTYPYPARISHTLRIRLEGDPWASYAVAAHGAARVETCKAAAVLSEIDREHGNGHFGHESSPLIRGRIPLRCEGRAIP
jgi:transposase